jgi:hypothetical protein
VLNARVVEQDVERAELVRGGADHFGDVGRLAHISGRVTCFHSEIFLDPGTDFFDLGLIAEAVEHDFGAVLRERARSGEADA